MSKVMSINILLQKPNAFLIEIKRGWFKIQRSLRHQKHFPMKNTKRLLPLLAFTALLGSASLSYAQQTIKFDDLSDVNYGTPIANGYTGFNWNNFLY